MTVSLVIPGRNCQSTIRACLEAAAPLLARGELAEIIFVDDGSTDDTASIVAEYPVRIVPGHGGGAGAARNLGWRAATSEWVWFIDSDCVAEPEALTHLAEHADDSVAGIGGSYGNMCPDSLVASLIHEEIAARHARMPAEVNYLGTFNVLYRRALLEELGGFDECRFNGPGVAAAEDVELAFRLRSRGHALRFEPRSRVGHFHLTEFRRYLGVQLRQGFYRVRLYAAYPGRMHGDAYSGLVDHLQPPMAMLCLAALPLLMFGLSLVAAIPAALLVVLLLLQLPMTANLVGRTKSLKYAAYIPFGAVRALWRGFGLTAGVLDHCLTLAWRMLPAREADPLAESYVARRTLAETRGR